MTGPSAPDPAVEVVRATALAHQPRWNDYEAHVSGEPPQMQCSAYPHPESLLTPSTCDWYWDGSGDEPVPGMPGDPMLAHVLHLAEHQVAALRAAAGSADVDDLAQAAYWAACEEGGHPWDHTRDAFIDGYETGARAVLDRLAITGEEDGADRCPVCGEPIGGEHGTPSMAHDCEYPGCVFGPMHTVGYHLVDGVRVPAVPVAAVPIDQDEVATKAAIWNDGYARGVAVARERVVAPVPVAAGDDAVERAAEAAWATAWVAGAGRVPSVWTDFPDSFRDLWRNIARAALRAGGGS